MVVFSAGRAMGGGVFALVPEAVAAVAAAVVAVVVVVAVPVPAAAVAPALVGGSMIEPQAGHDPRRGVASERRVAWQHGHDHECSAGVLAG
jgi:hypothetical protein